MKRINPLYILILSLAAAFFAAYSASKKEKELEKLQIEYREKKDLALRLWALKNAYSPKRKRALLQLLRSQKVQKSGIKFDEKPNRLEISGKNVDAKAANLVVSKVLNGTYNLKKLALRKANKGLDLEMEIVWR